MEDLVKQILGDEKAQVGVSLSHKIGGPHYSSMSLFVSVSLSCGQKESVISEAHNLALSLAAEFIEANLLECYNHLIRLVAEIPDEL